MKNNKMYFEICNSTKKIAVVKSAGIGIAVANTISEACITAIITNMVVADVCKIRNELIAKGRRIDFEKPFPTNTQKYKMHQKCLFIKGRRAGNASADDTKPENI